MKMFLLICRYAIIAIVLLIVLLYCFQNKFVYHPFSSTEMPDELIARNIKFIEFTTSQGKQTAYYVPPIAENTTETRRLWICFPGNQGLAVHFSELIKSVHAPNNSFLLVNYPGYGLCEGKPSRKAIMETLHIVLDVCVNQADINLPKDQNYELGIVGYSLGTAVSTEFATLHANRVKNMFLICPFSSLRDMAKHIIGDPLSFLLHENFDSIGLLKNLSNNPEFHCLVFAGKKDEIVPFEQEEAMGSVNENTVELIVSDEGTHWTTYVDALPVIASRINEMK